MKEFHIAKNDSGQRLNKFLEKAVPRLSGGMMHKYCRLKRIKRNGQRTEPSCRLQEGDILQLYINDELFEKPDETKAYLQISSPCISVIYEDSHVLLVDKVPGVVVHADERGDDNTLIAHIQAYLFLTEQWDPGSAHSFTPSLCNRIDRNTGGIVIAAKTAEALRILNEKIRDREMTKKYLCIVHGCPSPRAGRIEGFLRKDEKRNQVTVHQTRVPGAKTAVTLYRTLQSQNNLSLVECELITGRTHQIRAHMASIGHPLLGDGKYGANEQNRPFHEKSQALYSYKLRFNFATEAGVLQYLHNREFTVRNIPFIEKYFSGYSIR